MRGVLIAIEGLDQSGKETQSRRLREWFERNGRRVETLDFPCYTSRIAGEIAAALRGEREYAADALQLLFITNRYEYRARIEAWLAEGVVVICDRYLASSVAYGEAQGLDAAWLADTQKYLPQPDVTVLIDIAPATAVARKTTGRDRFERDLELLARVRASYARQAGGPSWLRVDGERSKDEVADAVIAGVTSRLASR
jgi:dTMP kinase